MSAKECISGSKCGHQMAADKSWALRKKIITRRWIRMTYEEEIVIVIVSTSGKFATDVICSGGAP